MSLGHTPRCRRSQQEAAAQGRRVLCGKIWTRSFSGHKKMGLGAREEEEALMSSRVIGQKDERRKV